MSLFRKLAGASSCVGLDIGSHAIKLAKVTLKKDNFILDTLAYQALPFGTIVDGEIFDSYTLEENLKELFEREKLGTRSIALALGGSQVRIKKISLPKLSQDEINSQLSILASQYLSITPDDFELTYQIVGNDLSDSQSHLLLVAVQKNLLAMYLNLLENCDLTPKIIDTIPTSLASFWSTFISDPVYVLLHMGANLCHWILVNHGVAIFYKEISFGGNTLTQDIREHMKLSFAEAEALKVTGQKERNLPKDMIETVRTSYEKLFHRIEQISESISHQYPEVTPKCLYLSGGPTQMHIFHEYIGHRFSLKTSSLPHPSTLSVSEDLSTSHVQDLMPFFPVAIALSARGAS